MRIYTRTGDKGMTSLLDGKRVKKYDLRLMVYGKIDALNVIVGWCRLHNEDERIAKLLLKITKELFSMCSVFATFDLEKLPEKIKAIDFGDVVPFEEFMDMLDAEMPKLTKFIFPGGSDLSLKYHEARVLTREIERSVVNLMDVMEEGLEEGEVLVEADYSNQLKYLNRLSDLFFILARYTNFKLGVEDEQWV